MNIAMYIAFNIHSLLHVSNIREAVADEALMVNSCHLKMTAINIWKSVNLGYDFNTIKTFFKMLKLRKPVYNVTTSSPGRLG